MSDDARAVAMREIAACTCLRLRRATRQATQLYDRALEPVELRITQFGLLAYVFAADRVGIGELAERMGMDATTLTRNLKPLEARGFLRVAVKEDDRRARTVQLTAAGREVFLRGMPLWRAAQVQLEALLGVETRVALDGLLDVSAARLRG
jgi:DNA-binding MarR family transcriptional regulator